MKHWDVKLFPKSLGGNEQYNDTDAGRPFHRVSDDTIWATALLLLQRATLDAPGHTQPEWMLPSFQHKDFSLLKHNHLCDLRLKYSYTSPMREIDENIKNIKILKNFKQRRSYEFCTLLSLLIYFYWLRLKFYTVQQNCLPCFVCLFVLQLFKAFDLLYLGKGFVCLKDRTSSSPGWSQICYGC